MSGLREVWQYREVLLFLAWRDLKVRYKQTVIGVAWVLLQPALMMAVFAVFLGALARVPSAGIPYPLFCYSGLLVFLVISRAITEGGMSLVSEQALISKVYFPRVLVPASRILVIGFDFLVACALLVPMMAFYRIPIGPEIAWLPVVVLFLGVFAGASALWTSAFIVKFRDISQVLPLLTQVLLFVAPVVYPSEVVPGAFRGYYQANPPTAIIEAFRWALLGVGDAPALPQMVGGILTVAFALLGWVFFRTREHRFADYLG